MARRLPEQTNPSNGQPAAQGPTETPTEQIAGGAAGIPEAATKITNPGEAELRAAGAEDAPDVPVRSYRVKNDAPHPGFPILYDGCLTHFPRGKVVSELAYDVERLRRQGLELEEMT